MRRREWMTMVLTGVMVLALGGGCAGIEVTDSDRGLEDQNRQAAESILKMDDVPKGAKSVVEDISKNSIQLLKNFGPPKDQKALQPYSTAASQKLREQSEKEHKEQERSKAWWMIGGSTALAAMGWFLRSTSLGSIPLVGQLLAKISPRLANGAFTNEKIAEGLQVALDKGRDVYDRLALEMRSKVESSGLPADVKAQILSKIPDGEKLVELIKNELSKRGVLPQNTKLYDANDTGVA